MEALSGEPVPLWVEVYDGFIWMVGTSGEVPISYSPRVPRVHLEPIEDEL